MYPLAAPVQGTEHRPIGRQQTVLEDMDVFRAQHQHQQGVHDERQAHRSAAHVRSVRY